MNIFQMEPRATYSLQTEQQQQQQPSPVQPGPNIEQILSLGMFMPIEDLIEDYPYAVAFVDKWFDDIFVMIDNCLIGEFNLLRLPQTCHEFLTRFLEVFQSRAVQDLFIEYLGSVEGQPHLRVFGGGLSTYLC